MRAELEEMRTVVEALAENIAALVANGPVQERGLDRPETAVIGEVLIVETEDSESAFAKEEQESEPSGSTQD
jgi:hypothetical protein